MTAWYREGGSDPSRFAGPRQANFWLFAAFLGVVFLMGGGSRADILSQPLVRIASVIVLAIWLFQIRAEQIRSARGPMLFLAAAFLLIALQLVPLPPSLWGALAGREVFLDGFAIAGVEPVWRPLTLTPDRTINSLLALLPPLAAAAGLAVMDRDLYARLVPLLIVFILLSAVVAIIQISTGALYLFRITNEGSAVGLFANRNHQALLLALAFPLLGYFAGEPRTGAGLKGWRSWLAGMIAVLLVPMLLVTGSRAGLFLGLAGGAAGFAIAAGRQQARGRRRAAMLRPAVLVPIGIMFLASAATIFLARDLSLQRLSGESLEAETRTQNLDLYMRMAGDFMPFGAGMGAFDPVYRMYEPHEALRQTYMNQAHNDLAQIAIEAGLLGLLLAAALLAWIAYRTWRLWTRHDGASAALGRTGSVVVVMMLLASLVDYPLRTPIHAVLIVIGLCFMLPSAVGSGRATSGLDQRPASTNSRHGRSQYPVYES